MRYLVDTHVLLWTFIDHKKLSPHILDIFSDKNNLVYYSPINLWEISIKYSIKKIDLRGVTPEELLKEIENSFFILKKTSNFDLITNYKLPIYHKDPFDRFLIWEAIRNDFILISVDRNMEIYKKEGLQVLF